MISDIAAFATIVSGLGLPFSAAVAWSLVRLRKLIREEVATARDAATGARADIRQNVVPMLTNDDTSAAQYAHQGVDIATRALEMAVVTDARVKRVEDKLDSYILTHMDMRKGA